MDTPFLSLFLGYEFPEDEDSETFDDAFLDSVLTWHSQVKTRKLLPSFSNSYHTALEEKDVKEPLELLRKSVPQGTFYLYQVDDTNGIVEIFFLDSEGKVEVDTPFDAEITTIDIRGAALTIPNAEPVLAIDNDLTPYLTKGT